MRTLVVIYNFMTVIVAASLLAFCLSSCDKLPGSEPKPLQLPPITTEGKNTFGCKVNGVVFLPKGGAFSGGNKSAGIRYESDTATLVLSASNAGSEQSFRFELFDSPDLVVGNEYQLSDLNYSIDFDEGDTNFCIYAEVYSGSLQFINYDKQKNIISGVFEFTATSADPACIGEKRITEGRFDMIYEPYFQN